MEKYINPDSDGRFYALQDAVAANCHDCVGCSRCCEGMGDSIVLDPYDLYQFQKSRNLTFDHLMQRDYLGLTMRDGIILPHLKMTDNGDHCPFLTGQGRCSIHNCRPGMCRLFPLGRDFQGEDMEYILLENACSNTNRTDVTVGAWIGVEPEERYHAFVKDWHDFRRQMAKVLCSAGEEQAHELSLRLLHNFFVSGYDLSQDFYPQYEALAARYRSAFADMFSEV